MTPLVQDGTSAEQRRSPGQELRVHTSRDTKPLAEKGEPIFCREPSHEFTESSARSIRYIREIVQRSLQLEGLEDRVLLYANLGVEWPNPSLVTYSFMPDGTSVGGVPSSLFATFNAVAPTATWKADRSGHRRVG